VLETLVRLAPLHDVAGEHLDRNITLEARVASAVDLSHAAAADTRDHLIRSESSAGTDSHGIVP
jgi:hypothetical protein